MLLIAQCKALVILSRTGTVGFRLLMADVQARRRGRGGVGGGGLETSDELISAIKVEFCYKNRQLSMEATVSKY